MRQEHTERKGRLLDLFLGLLLVLSLLSIGMRAMTSYGKGSAEAEERYSVTVRMQRVPSVGAEMLTNGQTLYTAAGEAVGSLLSFSVEEHTETLVWNGALYSSVLPREETCDLILTLSLRGKERDGVFLFLGREALAIGSEVLLYTQNTELRAIVYGVQKTD